MRVLSLPLDVNPCRDRSSVGECGWGGCRPGGGGEGQPGPAMAKVASFGASHPPRYRSRYCPRCRPHRPRRPFPRRLGPHRPPPRRPLRRPRRWPCGYHRRSGRGGECSSSGGCHSMRTPAATGRRWVSLNGVQGWAGLEGTPGPAMSEVASFGARSHPDAPRRLTPPPPGPEPARAPRDWAASQAPRGRGGRSRCRTRHRSCGGQRQSQGQSPSASQSQCPLCPS